MSHSSTSSLALGTESSKVPGWIVRVEVRGKRAGASETARVRWVRWVSGRLSNRDTLKGSSESSGSIITYFALIQAKVSAGRLS